ncbi:MAG: hypothetical protein KAT11_03645 [Phycisphaerae bacterium]|nr:hypothetical protein [Phycisphaerae bacterium]
MSIVSVIGQDQALDRLQQALRSQRVPHGYIFHGPAGVGKELCAREFAKILLCANRQKRQRDGQDVFDCCDSCDSCRAVQADVHPDYTIVYREQIRELRPEQNDNGSGRTKAHKATALAIDVIREKLNKPAQLTSAYGRGKVFVVREIHLANVHAQNALLKTLEEPPDGTVLILLADRLEGLLPTVLSRSQMVMFAPLGRDFLLERLTQSGCKQPQSGFWSRFADGSLGRALWLAEQDWYQAKIALVERLARLTDQDAVELAELCIDLAKSYSAQARKQGSAVSDTVAKQRMYGFLLAVVSNFYRDLMLSASGAAPAEWINSDQESALKQAAKALSLLQASRAVALVGRAEYLISKNVNANLVFEDLFGDLAVISCKTLVA